MCRVKQKIQDAILSMRTTKHLQKADIVEMAWGFFDEHALGLLYSDGSVYLLVTQQRRYVMQDRRTAILQAALAVLSEHGYAGFTQPRVATRAGMRQSHLTYYFPTRLALFEAVAQHAIETQLAALDATLDASSARAAARSLARVAGRAESVRVLMALAQAADEEPSVRELFRDMTSAIGVRAGVLLQKLGIPVSSKHLDLLHALTVGLAVTNLATGRADGEERAAALIQNILLLLSASAKTTAKTAKE
jgi:AcrR family transcriptional regulator